MPKWQLPLLPAPPAPAAAMAPAPQHALEPAPAAMAKPSQLEGRLLAILDATRRRGAVTRRRCLGAILLLLAFLLPIGAIQLGARGQRPDAAKSRGVTAVQVNAAGDLNAKIAALDLERAMLADVLRVFGAPAAYTSGQRHYSKGKLPPSYFMEYPDGINFQIADGRLRSLRLSKPGYVFPGGIQVGTPADAALAALPRPDAYVERDLAGIRDKVLYKNIMGDQGWNFYSRPDCGAWFMFANGKVMMIALVPHDFTIANPALEEAIQKIEMRYRSVGWRKLRLEYDWTWDVTKPKTSAPEKRVMLAWQGDYREETKDGKGRPLFHTFHSGLRVDVTPDENRIGYHESSFVHNVDSLIPDQWAESPPGRFATERMLGGGLPPEHRTISGLDCVRIGEMFFAPSQDWALVADGVGASDRDPYRVQVREFMKSGKFVFPCVIREDKTELAVTRLAESDSFDPKLLEFPQPRDGWTVAYDYRVWEGDDTTQKLRSGGVSPTDFKWHTPLTPTERRLLIVSLADWKITGRLDPEANHYPRPFYDREHDRIVWALLDFEHEEYRLVFIGDDLPANYGPAPWLRDLARSPDVATIVNAVYPAASQTITAPLPGNVMLFQIGEPDGKADEFALAPDGFRDFTDDGYSHPNSENWPYVHPGPADAWAGARKHTFAILTCLEHDVPSSPYPLPGRYRLTLAFADIAPRNPPRVQITIAHGRPRVFDLPAGGGGALLGQSGLRKPYTLTIDLTEKDLTTGANIIEITTLSGGWMIYDWIGLEGPKPHIFSPSYTWIISNCEYLPGIIMHEGKPHRQARLEVLNLVGRPFDGRVTLDGQEVAKVHFKQGVVVLDIPVPRVDKPRRVRLGVKNEEGYECSIPWDLQPESSFPTAPAAPAPGSAPQPKVLALQVLVSDAQSRPPERVTLGLLRQAPPGWHPPAGKNVDTLNFREDWADPATGTTWLFDGYGGATSGHLGVFKSNYSGQPLPPGRYRVTALANENTDSPSYPFPEFERRGAFGLSEPFQLGGPGQPLTQAIELKLAAGHPFTLRVLDAVTRHPVAGARLLLRRADGLPVASYLKECLTAGTGGELRFSSLAPGRYTVELSTDKGGNMPRYKKCEGVVIEVPAGRAGSADVLLEPAVFTAAEIEKNWPFAITGRVSDRDGKPMAGVWIDLDSASWNHSWVPGRTFTGPDGRYTMRFTLPEPSSAIYYQISAQRAGFQGQVKKRDGDDVIMSDENRFTDLERGKPRLFDFVLVPK